MKPRLLILTAGYGEGHNAAARALAAAAEMQFGAGAARVADAFALAAPRFNRWTRDWYRRLIDRAPGAWSRTYRWVDQSRSFPRVLGLLWRERGALARVLAEYQPTAICSTYPLYGFMLAGLRGRRAGGPPHYLVVTDSISINSLWWRAGGDGWCVPNADSAAVLRAAGVPDERVQVLGFPVSPRFDVPPEPGLRPALTEAADARVLILLNSAAPAAREMARALLARDRWSVTCAISHDERTRRELAAVAAARRRCPAEVLGWTDQIPQLLRRHHVVVSKAGGATTQEALAAGCPMIVNQIIPGQEEGNYELLRRHGAGARVESAAALIDVLEAAFANGGRRWAQWQRAAAALGRPDAARRIVAWVGASSGTSAPVAAGRAPAVA